MSDAVGRAGIDVQHSKSGAATRGNRHAILGESMRELSPETARHWAARNDLIVADDTHLNEAYVADGQGGYRRTRRIVEVIDYGDERRKRLSRKLRPDDTALTHIVAHLPKSLCDEHAGYYPPIEPGKSRRPRYTAKNRDEARAYFMDVIEHIRDNILTDRDAIHGFDINFDETTPHVQILLDPFGPDINSDDPSALRIDKNRVFGESEDVRYTEGPKKGQRIGGAVKMSRYQAELRASMIEKGWPVEFDADPVRRRRKESKREFQESQALLEDIEAGRKELDASRAAQQAAETKIQRERAELERDRAALPELKKSAQEEGYDAGWDEATRDAAEQIAEKHAEVLAAAQEEAAAMAAVLREKAVQEAQDAAQTAERTEIGAWLHKHRPDALEAYEEALKPKRGPRDPRLLFTSKLQGDERKGRELIVRLAGEDDQGRVQAAIELNADDPAAAKQIGLVVSGRWSEQRKKVMVGAWLPQSTASEIRRAAGGNVVGDACGVRADLLPPMDGGQGFSIKPGSVQPSRLRLAKNWREKQQDSEERAAAASRKLKDFAIDGVPRQQQRDEGRGFGF